MAPVAHAGPTVVQAMWASLAYLAFRGAVVLMALLAAAKLGDEMLRLVWRSGRTAAIDLHARHTDVHAWFAGLPVYQTMVAPTYPPASHALLWPFLGWLPFDAARWFWAATTVVALAVMTWLVVRESGATGTWPRAFAALMLLAMNATGVAIGNGQLILHVLAPLVGGLLLIHRGRGSWAEDLVASACVIFAMVKVTLAAPFLWLVLFAPPSATGDRVWPWRLRPTVLVAAGYVALTVFAASFQDGGLALQLREWLRVGREVSARGGDYANLNAWLNEAGLSRLVLPVSLVMLVALGAWLYRYRRLDLWVRLGVAALVARFWSYHRVYDDVLVVLAMVALLRIVTSVDRSNRAIAAVPAPDGAVRDARARGVATAIIGTAMFFMLLPARLGTAPPPWSSIFNGTHTITWLAMLAFLGWHAEDGYRRSVAAVGTIERSR